MQGQPGGRLGKSSTGNDFCGRVEEGQGFKQARRRTTDTLQQCWLRTDQRTGQQHGSRALTTEQDTAGGMAANWHAPHGV